MMPFREAVDLRKAYKKLRYKVGRSTKYGTQINSRGQLIIGRHEEDPMGKLRQWLPYAHQATALRGFSTVDISGRTKMKKIDHLINLNQKLDGIIEFRYDDDRRDGLTTGAELVGAGAAGAGGLKAYQAIRRKQMGGAGVLVGGEHAGLTTAPTFGTAARQVGREALQKAPEAVGAGLRTAGKKGLSILDRVLAAARLARV
jgi:hypothetical protein